MKQRGVLRGCLGSCLALSAACAAPPSPGAAASSAPPAAVTTPVAAPVDAELEACRERVRAVEAAPALPGAPSFDERRAEFLGRARGEPAVFVREPSATPDEALSEAGRAARARFDRGVPGGRVVELVKHRKGDHATLRALLLREGYAYAPDPLDALAIASHVTIADLFGEPTVFLQRGAETRRLTRETRRGETVYRYDDGPLAGHAADLLFADRVAATADALGAPLHRDLRALAEEVGFDRASIDRRTDGAILATLRFGDVSARAVLASTGARLSLACVAEDKAGRDAVAAARARSAPRVAALAALRETVTIEVLEALRFDRPPDEKTDERDGQLRPAWIGAYLQGRRSFDFEGTTFPVFDAEGRAAPPQVCVDFVLDTFERASGTWFEDAGAPPRRVTGRLEFDGALVKNRRSVVAFGHVGDAAPELFSSVHFTAAERVAFRDRTRFFDWLTARADEVRPGDVVAIQGKKADGKIHQHAILIEWADPVTGVPAGLADQMKRPRRRTWEGIMAEAPLRSLLYRVRPTATVLARVAPPTEGATAAR
ncbi:MAG TPA: hypothetical protein VGM56_17650 [Byssovorax sp.]|jgi:hypothetical protein